MTTALGYAAYGLLNVAAVLLLKANLHGASAAFRNGHAVTSSTWWVLLGAVLYASSFLCWLFILSRVDVTRAYPIAIGISMALTAAGATVVLGERLTPWHLAGTLVVFLGVAMLASA